MVKLPFLGDIQTLSIVGIPPRLPQSSCMAAYVKWVPSGHEID